MLLLASLAMIAGCNGQSNGWGFGRDADDHVARGRQLSKEGRLHEALAQLETAVKKDHDNPEAHCLLGDVNRRMGRVKQAESAYRTACELDKYNFRAFYNLGVVYQVLAGNAVSDKEMMKYLHEAEKAYIRSLTIDPTGPGSFDAHLNLGSCYFHHGRLHMAEQETRIALHLRPGSYRAKGNLGIIYQAMKEPQKAAAAFRESLQYNPNQPDTLLNLGTILLDSGKHKEALEVFGKGIELDPNNSQLWCKLGVCYFRMEQLDKAVQCFQQSMKLDPNNTDAYRGFGVVCMYQYEVDPTRTDLKQKAINAWSHSLKLKPDQEDLKKLIRRYSEGQGATPPAGSKP
jgi:tetratricopeptide (TPR) repeat protein